MSIICWHRCLTRRLPITPYFLFFSLLYSIADAKTIVVKSEPLTLNPERPNQDSVGQLHYRGGLVLSSPDAGFGGLSALDVSADGKRMIALTDTGCRFAAQLTYNEIGNLAGIRRATLDTLVGLDGNALKAKSDSDAEAMSPGVGGKIIVGFERRHRLWQYLPGKIIPEPLSHPDGLSGLPANNGLEGLALLANGSLFAIAEGPKNLRSTLAWVSNPNGWSTMAYTLDYGFRPTGAATLANGNVLVLERRFTLRDGVAARIRRLNGTHIQPGADLEPALVAEFRNPISVDNFEGIAIRQTVNASTLIYIVSDDNFNPMQRTLLMMFELRN